MTKTGMILSFLFMASLGVGSVKLFQARGMLLNRSLVMNEKFTPESNNKLWMGIKSLHNRLPIDDIITINLNSYGGYMVPSNVLYNRIKELQNKGRRFSGVVYGGCFSACGTLFALMDFRYMTTNGVYMQHLGSPMDGVTVQLERSRLIYDAAMFGLPFNTMFDLLNLSQLVLRADDMLRMKLINGIVPQPEIDVI